MTKGLERAVKRFAAAALRNEAERRREPLELAPVREARLARLESLEEDASIAVVDELRRPGNSILRFRVDHRERIAVFVGCKATAFNGMEDAGVMVTIRMNSVDAIVVEMDHACAAIGTLSRA